MPLYDYKCLKCGREFEQFNRVVDRLGQGCPLCGGDTKILLNAPGLSIFLSGWYEDIAPQPIHCETPQELREACDEHNATSQYIQNSPWKTSPGRDYEKAPDRGPEDTFLLGR